MKDTESKSLLVSAELAIKKRRYLEALTEIRKALFVEFEIDHSIYGWRDHDGTVKENLLASALRGGWRALSWTRDRDWISEHVKVPTEYVQFNFQDWRLQAMELGIHTMELPNLQRLTPDVFRADRKSDWAVTYDASFASSNATESNARYCLDRAVSIILKKQQHAQARREPAKDVPFNPPPIYVGRVLYERPDLVSAAVHTVQEGFTYSIRRIVGGFKPGENFYDVSAESVEKSSDTVLGGAREWIRGFLLVQADEA